MAGTQRFLTKIHPCIGYIDEIIYIYEAFDLVNCYKKPDDNEFMDVFELPLDEAVRKTKAGEITDVKTMIGILTAKMRKDNNEHQE